MSLAVQSAIDTAKSVLRVPEAEPNGYPAERHQFWTTPVPDTCRSVGSTGTVVPSRGSGQRARTDHVKP